MSRITPERTSQKLRFTTPEQGSKQAKLKKSYQYDFLMDDQTMILAQLGLSLLDRVGLPARSLEDPPQWDNLQPTDQEGFRRSFVYHTSDVPTNWEMCDDGWQHAEQFYHFSLRPTQPIFASTLSELKGTPLKLGTFDVIDQLNWVPISILVSKPFKGASETPEFEDPDVGWSAASLYHLWSTSPIAEEAIEACSVLDSFDTDETLEFDDLVQRLSTKQLEVLLSALNIYRFSCAGGISSDVEATFRKLEKIGKML